MPEHKALRVGGRRRVVIHSDIKAADKIVAAANKASVEETVAHIQVMSDRARDMLHREYNRNPDGRFGDNLLVAMSYLHAGV